MKILQGVKISFLEKEGKKVATFSKNGKFTMAQRKYIFKNFDGLGGNSIEFIENIPVAVGVMEKTDELINRVWQRQAELGITDAQLGRASNVLSESLISKMKKNPNYGVSLRVYVALCLSLKIKI